MDVRSTRRLSPRWFAFLACSPPRAVTLSGGGAEDDEPALKTDTFSLEDTVPDANCDGLQLGEGFDSTSGEPTGESCLEHAGAVDRIEVDYLNEKKYWAEFLHTEDDIERKLKARLDVDLDIDIVEATLDAHYTSLLNTDTSQDVLTIGLSLKTVQRDIITSQNYTENQACDGASGLFDFGADCGDQYVDEEVYGGFCLMSADVSDFSEHEKRVIKATLEVGATGLGDGEFERKWAEISDNVSQYLRFSVDCAGVDDPSDSVLDNGELTRNGFSDYLHQLECGSADDEDCSGDKPLGYREAYNQLITEDAGWHSSFGEVIDRRFEGYANALVEFCMGRPFDDGDWCYTDFMQSAHHKREAVSRVLGQAEELLDNQSAYYWGTDEASAIQEWKSFAGTVSDCAVIWKERVGGCYEFLRSDQPDEELCAACSVPEECEPASLNETMPSVPDLLLSRRSSADLYPLHQGTSQKLALTSDRLCTLASVRGRFAGGGEKVLLENNNGRWEFSVASKRTDEKEELVASALCVDTSSFYDGKGNSFTTFNTLKARSTGGTATMSLNSYPYVAAVSGLRGKFNGGGEKVRVEDPITTGSSWELQVETKDKPTEGWATAFGLDHPFGGQPDWGSPVEYVVSNAGSTRDDKIYTKRMAPTDEAHCFLTHISGKFYGGGERVRIYEDEGAWMLEIWAGCDDYSWGGFGDECQERKHVEVKARCLPFDQSP